MVIVNDSQLIDAGRFCVGKSKKYSDDGQDSVANQHVGHIHMPFASVEQTHVRYEVYQSGEEEACEKRHE